MELEEAMRTQRAIRRLRPDPVDDQLILRLIELALKAPTGGNQQNWEFVVVKDREVKRRLGRLNMQAWRVYGGIGRLVMRRRPSMLRVIRGSGVAGQALRGDPGGRCGLPARSPPAVPTAGIDELLRLDLPVGAEPAAGRARGGLGAALITLPLWSTILARRALGLPWNVTPCAVVPLGWPRGRYGPTTRRPVGEVVSLDRYGNRPFG